MATQTANNGVLAIPAQPIHIISTTPTNLHLYCSTLQVSAGLLANYCSDTANNSTMAIASLTVGGSNMSLPYTVPANTTVVFSYTLNDIGGGAGTGQFTAMR